MKDIICVAAIAALIGTPAFAADMAVKAPPSPPPSPVYNWTGFYVGGNVGASFGHAKTDFNVAPVTVTTGGGASFTTPSFSGSALTEPAGVIGGGQIGYNWQFSPILVAGIEADIQASGEKDSITITHPFSVPFGIPVTGTAVTDYQTKISWFGTVRGRIGYVFGDGAVMSYVTGGWPTARWSCRERVRSAAWSSGTLLLRSLLPMPSVILRLIPVGRWAPVRKVGC